MVKQLVANWMPQDLRARVKPALVRMGYYSQPSFLILGGVKCGSTALHHYLCDHPRIVSAWDKEIHFFDQDVSYKQRGLAWYHSKFPPPYKLRGDSVTFEATPNYLYHCQRCAPRIHLYNPALRLIALLRNPVERAYSFWNMLRVFAEEGGRSVLHQAHLLDPAVQGECRALLAGKSFLPFEECVRRELATIDDPTQRAEMSFVRAGLYAEQIEHYLKFFDREQLLVLESRALLHETRDALQRVTEFLGLPDHHWSAYKLHKVNAYAYREQMPRGIRQELTEFYRPHNQRLYDLLGVNFGW